MWLFKPKASIGEVCGEFYNTEIFFPMVGEKDRGEVYWDAALGLIAGAAPSFSAVDQAAFQAEFRSLFVELFGLAWVHRLKEERYVLPQALFTKRYLEQIEQLQVWEAKADYSRAIAASLSEGRAGLVARWVENGVGPDVAERAANRVATDDSWKEGIAAQMLADVFQKRLGRDVSSVASARIQALITRLYERALSGIVAWRVQATD